MRREALVVLLVAGLTLFSAGCDVLDQLTKEEPEPPEVLLIRDDDDDDDDHRDERPPTADPAVPEAEPEQPAEPVLPTIYVTAAGAKWVMTPRGRAVHIIGTIGCDAGAEIPEGAQFGIEMSNAAGQTVRGDVVIEGTRGRFDYLAPNFGKQDLPLMLRAWGRAHPDEEYQPVGPPWAVREIEAGNL